MLLQIDLIQPEKVTEYFFMNYVLAIAGFIALAALFVYKPEKFKALPYIVALLMLIIICGCSDMFYSSHLFYSGSLMDKGLLYFISHDLEYHVIWSLNGSSTFGLGIFSGIPIITLLVMMLIRKFKKQ